MKKILIMIAVLGIALCCQAQRRISGKIKSLPIKSEDEYIDTVSYAYLTAEPIQAVAHGKLLEITLLYDIRSMIATRAHISVADSDAVRKDFGVHENTSHMGVSIHVKKSWDLGLIPQSDDGTIGMIEFTRPKGLSKNFWIILTYFVKNEWGHEIFLKVTLPSTSKQDHLKSLTQHDIPGWLLLGEYRKILAAYQ